MDMRQLGPLRVSDIGLGCNNLGRGLDRAASERVVHAALDAGVTFFDTADKYGGTRSEEFLGDALRHRRDDTVIATKFGLAVDADPRHAGASRRWVTQAAEASLRRLGTDRIDLYQLHSPDPDTPVEETLGVLDELVDAGKVRALGICNATTAQIKEYRDAATATGATWFVSAQDEFSLLRREVATNGILDRCRALDMGFLPFYPLASGLLTGKYRAGMPAPEGTRLSLPAYADVYTDADHARTEALRALCDQRGWPLLHLAVSWLLASPTVRSVICGASSPEQVRDNAEAGGLRLTADDLAVIDEITL